MIQEDYVTPETAKLLNEKGFKGDCIMNYIDNELMNVYNSDFPSPYELDNYNSEVIDAPTLWMAMKWLRENHNLFIQVEFDPPIFSSDIYKMDEIDEYGSAKHIPPTFVNAKSYEEAVEIALKYSLENLI